MKLKSIICSVITVLLTLSYFLFTPTAHISYADGTGELPTAKGLPSEYCMRDEYVIYAQNQDSHGYCWNFAATMAAATTIMKATGEYYDFSELWTGISLFNSSDKYNKVGAGGTSSYQYEAMKEAGLMLEADLPYQNSNIVSNENAADYYNFYEKYSNDDLARSLVCDTKFSKGDIEDIKKHIYDHGSVYMAFSFKTGFIESDGVYYLPPNQNSYNSSHAVSVIGWDDNYQKEIYLDGSETPTLFKGAWIILNSYTEKSGTDGISFVFYDDSNISVIEGYRYETDTSRDLYFYDKIESGFAYPTYVKGKYYGDFTAESGTTKQKNIFYDDVNLEYSYTVSSGANIESIDIYLGDRNVTDDFGIRIDAEKNRFYISKNDAAYGQYKVIVTYGNGEKSDTYLNNFFVTSGLVGEEIEFDYDNNSFTFNPGRDLEYYSYISTDKNYVIYTDKLSGTVSFLPTEQSVYSEKNMSIPSISYEITDGKSCTVEYTIVSDSGYELEYNFTFEYCSDTSLQPVNVYYDLGGGVNNSKNYAQELAGPTSALMLYEPTRPGYTFAGWYLDYGNGSKKVSERDGIYYVSWDDIHHMGEQPTLNASSYYKQYYNNSSTVFVYARWEEEEYYSVDLTVVGNGVSQIDKKITVCSDDSVRYLFNPSSGWCLSGVDINGTAVVGDELVEIIKSGLLLKNLDRDTTVTATFSEGVYLSLKLGENVKNAYIIGTYNGESRRFYDGDFIPAEYFDDLEDRFDIIKPRGDKLVINKEDLVKPDPSDTIINDPLPPIKFPGRGTEFTLVVELLEDNPGYTYVLDDVNSYIAVEKGVFKKSVIIKKGAELTEINVGSAHQRAVERVEISYSVGSYVLDHYLSPDINGTGGVQNSAVYDAGQIVYLFIKKPQDTFILNYTMPDGFEQVAGQWYRKAIYVNADKTDLGIITAYREYKTYTVTWKNWDGSVIYTESYRYGAKPVFNDKNSKYKDSLVRPDDETYSYIFSGWDKELSAVACDVTYTATYEAVLRRYVISVEPAENGTVTPEGDGYINCTQQLTYTFTPDDGYKIRDVIVNGESVGAVSSYTFSDVYSDQTLRVEFEMIRYSVDITTESSSGGSITPSLTVSIGESARIDFSPNIGYKIKDVKIDGVSIGAVDHYVFDNVDRGHSVTVEYELDIIAVGIAAATAVALIVIVSLIACGVRRRKRLYRR